MFINIFQEPTSVSLIYFLISAPSVSSMPSIPNILPTSIGPKLMIDALKAIGTNVTIAAAKKLESTFASNTPPQTAPLPSLRRALHYLPEKLSTLLT